MSFWVIRRERVVEVEMVVDQGVGDVFDVGWKGEEEDVDAKRVHGLSRQHQQVLSARDRHDPTLTASG
jgi:hypothetical protein